MWWFSLISVALAFLLFGFIFIFWRDDVKEALLDTAFNDTDTTKQDLTQVIIAPSSESVQLQKLDDKQRKLLQNRVYKRWGAALIVLGLLGGFAPSITKALIHRHVWDVGTDQPHTDVDIWLYIHIAGGIMWGICVAQQLISGGSSAAYMQRWHRIVGWMATFSVILGIAISGGLVWTIHYDFCIPESTSIGAGVYTIILALATSINMVQAVRFARKRQFSFHKDYALMAVMWTMDPAVHRSIMWSLHLICYSCFSPDAFIGTKDSLNVIAKMPANVILFSWCFCIAVHGRRLNRILIINGSGQYLLWILQIVNELNEVSLIGAVAMGLVLILIYIRFWKYGRNVMEGNVKESLEKT